MTRLILQLGRENRHTHPGSAERILTKMNPKLLTLGHIIIRMPKIKNKKRVLKAARERQ